MKRPTLAQPLTADLRALDAGLPFDKKGDTFSRR